MVVDELSHATRVAGRAARLAAPAPETKSLAATKLPK
jgi:hypothetical protein